MSLLCYKPLHSPQVPESVQRRRRPASSTTRLTWWWKLGTPPRSPAGRMAARSWPSSGCEMASLWRWRREMDSCSPCFCRLGASSFWAWEEAGEVSRTRASTLVWPATVQATPPAVMHHCILQVRLGDPTGLCFTTEDLEMDCSHEH